MGKPHISVIMPVYNGSQYLQESIQSILDQTYSDFEFIIVDDGSTEDISSIVMSFDDPRIKYSSNDENIGLTKSLNIALDLAEGDLIARQDGDDISHPQRFELQVKALETFTGLCTTYGEGIDAHGAHISDTYLDTGIHVEDNRIADTLNSRNCLLGASAMFSREVFDTIGYYDERLTLAQDYNYWLRLVRHFNVRVVRQNLYSVRNHGKRVSIEARDSWSYERKLHTAQICARTCSKIPSKESSERMYRNTNRFLRYADTQITEMSQLKRAIESVYVGMRGKPHPSGANDPASIKIHWSREWEYPWAVLHGDVAAQHKVLDCGCGGSPLLPYLVDTTGCDAVGLDKDYGNLISKEQQSLIQGTGPLCSLWGYYVDPKHVLEVDVDLVRGNMNNIPFPDDHFDRVFCISVIEHVKTAADGKKSIEEMVRVLKPGGRLVITMDHSSYKGHVESWCIGKFKQIIEWSGLSLIGDSDFTVPEMSEIHGPWHVVGFVLQKPEES
jgi:glycosyltransferase involved in cell wall biosynthesis/SAM-dependent methyltransferase